ncbi:MAG: ribosomal small subunit pseudouridine synthase RsuA [Pseudomonadota bacterium]|jgi:16S rRNA pseudouridine516 synthase
MKPSRKSANQPLDALLFSQGFGTRRICAGLVQNGLVQIDGQTITDPDARFATDGLVLTVEGIDWPYHEIAVVMLNKPVGYECSQRPKHHPSVLTLLPAPLRNRGVQPIGRLDLESTGMLLLTDDGALIHRATHPKRHVPKVYRASTARPIEPTQIDQLLAGVVLLDDPAPVRAVACHATGERELEITLSEGKYHQVRRMLAAVGNHVEALHRFQTGLLTLPADLPEGKWCWVSPAQQGLLFGADKPA